MTPRAEPGPARPWRSPDPRPGYEAVIIGSGGHGLATAYYLAAEHGLTDVAVLERGWLAGGNMARNTAIIRSNYLWPASAAIYEHALRLWEGLENELGRDLHFSRRGVINLAQSTHEVRESVRRVNADLLAGIDAEWLEPEQVAELVPILDIGPHVRHPVLGATYQPRAGIADHDLVAWAFAAEADRLGVDIIQDCEVTGFRIDRGHVTGVRTTRGDIATRRVGLCAAGRTSVLTDRLGLRLPLQSHPLQALVSQLLTPVLDTVVMSAATHVYVSQADKGELVLGAGVDAYNGYGSRGSFTTVADQVAAAVELYPVFAHADAVRTWAGTVDTTPDASPIIGATPVGGVHLNCGWGTGGFKATPGAGQVFADTIARDRPHPLTEPFSLDRFRTGALVDEHGAAAVAH